MPAVTHTERAAAHALDPVLRAQSVAIIGASADPAKRGHHAVRALIESGYAGRIVPVHPAGGQLLGLPVATKPSDLAEPVDLILVCTPAPTVPSVLRVWADAGARGAVVLASGFAESGEAGAALEQEIRRVVRDTGMRVVGPNTSGLINVALGLNLIGLRGVRAGSIALLVQSGNLTLQLVTQAAARTQQGFSFCIGVGNETDIRFDEYLDFLARDDATRAILVHTEGFRDGRRFIEAAAEAVQRKPVVLLKGARTAAGGAAARSHTGAIAGSFDLLRAGLARAGVFEVTRSDELLHAGETLASQPPVIAGRGIALLSDGGGHAALAVDALQQSRTPLATLEAATREQLRALLGSAAAVANPVDLAGAADRAPLIFARTLDLLLADPGVGGVLVVGLFGGYAIRFAESLLEEEILAARAMAASAAARKLPLVVHSLYAPSRSDPLCALSAAGVPVIESLEIACAAIHAAAHRGDMLARTLRAAPRAQQAPTAVNAAVTRVIDGVKAEGRSVLLEPEARAILEAYGATLVPATFCTTRDQAALAAALAEQPVAVRVVSPAAPHKTEAGGVALGILGSQPAALAFDQITRATADYAASRGLPADVRGVLVSPMQKPPIAALIIGAHRDPQFGPALTIGAGGSAVEVLRDVAHCLLPASDEEMQSLVLSLRMAPVLTGLRGRPAADLDSVIQTAHAVAQALLNHELIAEIEVNPLFCYDNRCIALDARAYLRTR